jgi:hypothetical protein
MTHITLRKRLRRNYQPIWRSIRRRITSIGLRMIQKEKSPVAHTGLRRIGMVHRRSDGSSLKHRIAETRFFQFDQHQPGDGFRQISVPCGLLSAVRRPDRYSALACPHLSTKGRAALPFNGDIAVHKASPVGCGTNLRRSRLVASSCVGPANLRLYRRRGTTRKFLTKL